MQGQHKPYLTRSQKPGCAEALPIICYRVVWTIRYSGNRWLICRVSGVRSLTAAPKYTFCMYPGRLLWYIVGTCIILHVVILEGDANHWEKVITRVLGLTYAPCMDAYTNSSKLSSCHQPETHNINRSSSKWGALQTRWQGSSILPTAVSQLQASALYK